MGFDPTETFLGKPTVGLLRQPALYDLDTSCVSRNFLLCVIEMIAQQKLSSLCDRGDRFRSTKAVWNKLFITWDIQAFKLPYLFTEGRR